MKRIFFPLIAVLISASVSFFLQGCNIRFVVSQQATPVPYPNAWHVELRVRAQVNRISAGLQQGRLSQDSADVLAENDALVRRMVREYQGPRATMVDLDGNQAVFLDNMLNDNDRYIDEAFQHNQAWVSSFQGGNFDYTSSDRTLYIVFLDYQLNHQQTAVESGLSSGSLTSLQANELRSRIKTIRELRYNAYRSNGRIDLSEEQVHQLSQMTEDNARYLGYRLKGSNGRWNREQFNNLKSTVPAGLGNGGNPHWGRRPNDNGSNPATVPASPHQSSNRFHTQDSVGQNAVNPHVMNGSTNSTGSLNPGSGQATQPARVLATPTSTMGPRNGGQSPTIISTPIQARNFGQITQPTPIPAVPTNTLNPKFQAPVATPTNPPVKIQKPVVTPTPKWARPTLKATKVSVKATPTPTQAPKKDDQESQDQKGDGLEKKRSGPRGD